jgi:hypothetical protein
MIKKIKMSELSEFDPSKYLDDDEALRFSSSGMKECQYSHRERHWILPCRARTGLQASAVPRACSTLHEAPAPPFAGMTFEELLA